MRLFLHKPLPASLALLMIAALIWALAAFASPHVWHESHSAFEQAREAVGRGEAMPLNEARERLPQIMPGQVVATDYEFEFERWVYEFKVVDTQGRLRAVHLDARTGELVKVTDY